MPLAHDEEDGSDHDGRKPLPVRDQNPAGIIEAGPRALAAEIGAFDEAGAIWVARQLAEQGKLRDASTKGCHEFGLTFAGWDWYDELSRSHSEGPIAFMAMPFGNAELDRIFRQCFKPAIAQTGFELRQLDETAPAGLIDDRLRVEIRKSRFLSPS